MLNTDDVQWNILQSAAMCNAAISMTVGAPCHSHAFSLAYGASKYVFLSFSLTNILGPSALRLSVKTCLGK